MFDSGSETNPAVSPDGRWIAFQSQESGRAEVYVQPFPNIDDGKWEVSSGFGADPMWSPDGSELFFLGPGGLEVAAVETEPTFSAGTPEVVFPTTDFPLGTGREFDISPDGNRFLFRIRYGEADDTEDSPAGLVLVFNWFQELTERVPVP